MKKLHFLFLLLLFSNLNVFAQIGIHFVTEEEALEKAKTYIIEGDYDYYIGLKDESTKPNFHELKWYVFVDMEPMKGWEHKCCLIKIPYHRFETAPQTNNIITPAVEKLTMPPLDVDLKPIEVKNRYGSKANYKINVPFNVTNNVSEETAGHTYALILSGGVSKRSNYSRYWNDCSYIYQTLVNRYKIPKDNIYPVIADGADPGEDMYDIATGKYKSSPVDLDFDGLQDLYISATKNNVKNILADLSGRLTNEDHLFIYVIDHGGTLDYVSQSYICLWNNERLFDYELASMLDDFNVGGVSVLLGQCFSGGFIDNLQKPGRVITTACTGSESSYACKDIPYDEFVFQWTKAMNVISSVGDGVYPDANGDALISMAEAFDYAKKNDRQIPNETPLYSSVNESVGEDLGFENIPKRYSLFMRDDINDTGKEPSNSQTFWDSPDIWVRNNPDGIENQFSEPIVIDDPSKDKAMYIYVRVHNRGIADYNDSKMYLHLFWANAGLGLDANTWLGISNDKGSLFGGVLTKENVTAVIPCGSSTIFKIPWFVANDLKAAAETGYLHICLLAFLSKSYGNEYADETILAKYINSVVKSNRLAQKNMTIISNNNGAVEVPLDVRNVKLADRSYNIEIKKDTYMDKNLFDAAEFSVTLSPTLYNKWVEGGNVAEEVTSYTSDPKKLYFMGNSSKICNIKLGGQQVENVKIECNIRANLITKTDSFKVHLVQRDALTGEIVGGEAFVIVRSPRTVIFDPQINKIVENGSQVLYVSNLNEDATYQWFDTDNKILGKDSKLVVPANFSGEINLRAKAVSDGVINYAKINIDKTQGIKEVSPLPFESNLLVKLQSPAAAKTVLVLTSLTGSVSKSYPFKEGESEINLFVSQLQEGIYNLTLIENGVIIETKKINKI